MAKELTVFEKRCADCPNCKIKNGTYYCDECFGQKCNEVDDCPEGVTIEDINRIDEEMKTQKINLGAKAENKERKPRERKPDEEKEHLISILAVFLEEHAENVVITNKSKVIEFDLVDNHYKIDLIRQRKPKK